MKTIYNTVRDVYNGDCFIPLNKRGTKNPKKLGCGNVICEAGLAMHRDGKFSDSGRTRQKFCCPFKRSKSGECPCNHKNWNNGKKNHGCTKYVTIPDDYRLSIDRDSIAFKSVYAQMCIRDRLYEDQIVTRAEALVMLKRAFGDFPELTGHNARVAIPKDNFTDIPQWSEPELEDVFNAGIVAGTEKGIFRCV